MRSEHLEIRKRLRANYRLYAKHALKIRNKENDIVPLTFNAAQDILDAAVEAEMNERGYVRIIILKGRQQGLSTYVGGRVYHGVSQNRARKGMVVAHVADSTRALFDMTKRYHDNCPDLLRPTTKYSSRRELAFNALDSSYVVATAGGENIGRGETLSHLHASEYAFWQPSTAEGTLNGLLQAVPDIPGTEVYIESTANGFNHFREFWEQAVHGQNGYRAVFIPWILQPEYTLPVPQDFERTPLEQEYADLALERYGITLTDGQLQWRRKKIGQGGGDLFKQEYPITPDEAFLSTGRPVFLPEAIDALLKQAKDPIKTLTLESTGPDDDYDFEWQHHPAGELRIYREFDPKETYYIGADVAEGTKGGDWSVAQVLDGKRRQVAIWRGQPDPHRFGTILYHLGKFYEDAHEVIELNNHGILPNSRLHKDYQYANLYFTTEVDKVTERESTTFGFRTTVKTKPLIIDQLRARVREGEIEINDRLTLMEMRTFIVNEAGNMEAEKGCHDDAVISLALVNHINEGSFTPIKVTDDWYIEAI